MAINTHSSIPRPDRPHIEGYGIPQTADGMLAWDFVVERMAASRHYWVATVTPDGRPHSVPVWGVWLDGTLHFGGGPKTLWQRNLQHNPRLSIHLESGDEVVIIEGTATVKYDSPVPELERIDDAYEEKYGIRHGPPVWVLHPLKAFAWKEYPTSVTRWVFDTDQA